MSVGLKVEVDAIDFQIACRRFNVRATITRERQMPVVDEFVLRLLAVAERMPVVRMRSWFGFSESEMETVLVDLGRRALVEFDGDDVVLAPAGRDLFRAVPEGGVPQLVEVAPLLGDVWFDLVSRNMVPRSRARQFSYLVPLREHAGARDLPESFAREAFETNFRDYARRIRRFPDADAVNLYSISDVEGGRFGYQTLRSGVMFEPEKVAIRPTFPELDAAPANFGKLTVAANEAWQVLAGSDAAPTTAAEYDRMTGDPRLASLIADPSQSALWSTAVDDAGEAPGFRPTLGASYLEHNAELLADLIALGGRRGERGEIIWLRPNGSSWGRSLRVADTLQLLREATRNADMAVGEAMLAMSRSTHKSFRSNHKRLFERGVLLPQGHLPTNIEVLMVTGVGALVSVHLPVGGHSVPIGGLVTDPKRLARIEERLNGDGERWEQLWKLDLRRKASSSE